MADRAAIEEIVERLRKDGWREQKCGTIYLNGTLETNLLKDGEIISISQEFCPDEEFIEQEWGDAK